jgi:hypothetical protein
MSLGGTKYIPDQTYFLLDIFNTRIGFLSYFLIFPPKFAQLYLNSSKFGILSVFCLFVFLGGLKVPHTSHDVVVQYFHVRIPIGS